MQILTFELSDTLHAVELSTVEAVARWEEVEGRGLPALDLARWFGYEGGEEREGDRAPVLVMHAGGRRALVRIERSGEVIEVAAEAARDPPEIFPRRMLRGVIEHAGGLVVLLDGAELVEEAWRAAEEEGA